MSISADLNVGIGKNSVDRVDRLLSYEQIRELVARYSVSLDARDLDEVVSLFVDDVNLGEGRKGRDALRAFIASQQEPQSYSICHLTTHLIEFEDKNRARGVLYCRAEFQMGEEWVVQQIQYRDRYERRDGTWYFTGRKHLLWYGADMLERPIGLPPAQWPTSLVGSGELPDAWIGWHPIHPRTMS